MPKDSKTDAKYTKPLNLEQAANYIYEKKETIEADVKKATKDAQISIAPPKDRRAFLMYAITLLQNVSEGTKTAFCTLANRPPNLFSTRDVAIIFKQLLSCRIHGASDKQIAFAIKVSPETVKAVEALALRCVSDTIAATTANGIPILGGM